MQFIDLKTQYSRIKEKVDASILNVLEHGRYVFGQEIIDLENKLAKRAGTKHALACGSGTDALLIPLMAWGIGPGDAVFVPSFTFVATGEVVCLTGATPVFVDCDETFNIDTNKLEESIKYVKNNTKLNPKAIIPVDLFGLPADYDAIESIATKYELKILEDAAQGFGGVYKGKASSGFGAAAGTSFYPAKPLACYGDGGAALTNDDELIEVFRSIRVHGMGGEPYDNIRLGLNGRMDTMQAAVLLAKLDIFDDEVELRNKVASKYSELIGSNVRTPIVPDGSKSVWAQYSVLADSESGKDEIRNRLQKADVPSAVFYPLPMHKQTAYSGRGLTPVSMEMCEDYAKRIFSLPMHPYLADSDIEIIANIINR